MVSGFELRLVFIRLFCSRYCAEGRCEKSFIISFHRIHKNVSQYRFDNSIYKGSTLRYNDKNKYFSKISFHTTNFLLRYFIHQENEILLIILESNSKTQFFINTQRNTHESREIQDQWTSGFPYTIPKKSLSATHQLIAHSS